MKSDNDLTMPWVTPGLDGDIKLDKGRTQKSLTVDVHSLVGNRSTTVHCSEVTMKKKNGRDGRIFSSRRNYESL